MKTKREGEAKRENQNQSKVVQSKRAEIERIREGEGSNREEKGKKAKGEKGKTEEVTS